MNMKSYYEDSKKLSIIADRIITKAKTRPIPVGLLKFKLQDKYDCSWSVVDKKIKLLCIVDPRYTYDKDKMILSFDKSKQLVVEDLGVYDDVL